MNSGLSYWVLYLSSISSGSLISCALRTLRAVTARLYCSGVNGKLVFNTAKVKTLTEVSYHRRTLNDYEKADYITAVKCLQSKPAQQPLIKAARTRFDEFQALHINLADGIHVVVSNFIGLQGSYLVRFFFHRVNFFLGIDASYASTKIHYELSVAIRGHIRTFTVAHKWVI